jgi:DNA replication factor GINS
MNLDELQSVRNRERQTDSLQQLSDTFYRDAGEFIRELKRERARVAEAADDPFDSTDVRRLTDEIKTAESTVESIYERRVGKIVKQASLEAAGMPADADGLTAEELDLFETMVAAIENSREHVLDGLLAGGAALDCTGTGGSDPVEETEPPASEGPGATPEPDPDPDPEAGTESEPVRSRSEGVSAAEAMGAGASEGPPEPSPEPAPERDTDTDPTPASEPDQKPEPAASYPEPGSGGEPGSADIERATVRITDDVGEIYGVDDRAYELSAEDVVTLPTVNAGPLVEQGAAERLD